ncbi:glycosyltransferase family 4 protein [Micromonospora sp. WMMC241]|uniref:glycosyltransferase family 4 protein n=1 Tax=Micromonospora sp. WMMC241 TaxID=3015159 RepID=UPI0022B6F354|nr:glycosyltransferase family 4 protein [Micromonospora sp. WMMC241]MCZ7437318.1 glycosyltransferase family 4 protein [Micromonospora sp. WMMC241]
MASRSKAYDNRRWLRIAMVVPPWYEVPPPGYGGVEQVVAGLVDALVDRGHDVTLFGAGAETGTRARLAATVEEPQMERLGEFLPEVVHVARTNRMIEAGGFDIVHDHTVIGPLTAQRRSVPTVATVHGNPVDEYGDVLRSLGPDVRLVAISDAQRRLAPTLPWYGTVHNGMVVDDLAGRSTDTAADREGRPVLWLARFSAEKAPELAIEACRAARLPLVLAGKCVEPFEQEYFSEVVEPMLGPDVEVVLNPDRSTTARLLLSARCLIMPIQWDEPFGMVVIEAMAVGTPVVTLNRGAMPELVQDGVTGFIRDDPGDLPQALHDAARLSGRACQEHVSRNFSTARMAEGYELVYADRRNASPLARAHIL